jgi:hypothetical protein
MTDECCPTCGHEMMVTAIRGPTAIAIYPCGHEIGHLAELIDAPDLDPLSPGEWLTHFFADSDD